MARYRETAVNDGGSGGSKYSQLADNARANNPLAMPEPTYGSSSGSSSSSNYPKPNQRVEDRIAQQRAEDEAAAQHDAQDYSWVDYVNNPVNNTGNEDTNHQYYEYNNPAVQEAAQRLAEQRAAEQRALEEQQRLAEQQRQAELQEAVNTAQAQVEEQRQEEPVQSNPFVEETPAPTLSYTPRLSDWRAREYPVYTGEQPELYGQRNRNADYYRGRELIQPVYTTTQQAKDALKFGARMSADEAEDQTEFYTGPTATEAEPTPVTNPLAFRINIPGIPGVGPNITVNPLELGVQNAIQEYNEQGGTSLFPTDYGGTTIPGMPESPNPLAPSQQAARRLGGALVNGAREFTRPMLETIGNGANEIVSDYDTAITDTDDAILDAIAGLYNASNSDGWLTEQASDLYGTLPKIDPDSPMADVLEQQRRDRLNALVRQIQADDELVDDRPDITGQQIKDALKESQQETRAITNELIGGAREITRPIKNDLFNWATSGSNYGENVTEAADAAQAAGLIPGTPAYERFVNNYLGAVDGRTSEKKNTNEKPRTYGYTDNILNSYANATGRALEDMDESDYRAMQDLNREATAVAEQARFNALANGDVRNIPPQDLVSMLGRMTDPAYAQELEQQYQRFRDLGMNDRQISAELYRRAAEHMNPLARATDAQGNLHYDFALAGSGVLPEDMAIPTVDANGNGNAAFNEFANSVDYFDKNGNTIYRNADGSFTEAVPKSDGTVEYRKYSGNPEDITSTYHYTPDQVLSMYVNPNGGRNGEPTWRGLDAVFEGLTPEERAGMEELLANFVGGGDLNRIREGFNRESTGLTEAQYERLAQLFLNKMPAIQNLIDRGVLSERDVANFFFKAPSGSGSGSGGSGSGSGSGGSGSGYSRGGYGYSRGGGYSNGGYNYNYGGNNRTAQSSPSAATQRQNRVYNIMKNWSF